jgi:uncharacterized protein (DUF2126 family)
MRVGNIEINAGRLKITIIKPDDGFIEIHVKAHNPFTQKTKTHFAEIQEEDLASIIYALVKQSR